MEDHFGAPPAAPPYPYPPTPQPQWGPPQWGPPPQQPWPAYGGPAQHGMPVWAKVLIGLAIGFGAFVVVGIVAAIVIPVILNQRMTVRTPPVVLGFPRLTDQASRAQADQFLVMPTPGRKVAAAYGRDGLPVVVFGGASHRMGPAEVQDFFEGAERSYTGSAASLRFVDVEPGPRGGEMRCAAMRVPQRGPASLCLFADTRSYGVITVYGDDGATIAVQVRDEVERPS